MSTLAPADRRTLVSLEDAADYLGVSKLTLRRRVAAGDIKAYRLGPRVIRLDMADVDALLEPIPTTAQGGESA